MDEVWQIFCRHLYFAKIAFNLEIHSFVLMSNHFHLILSTPDLNLSEAMSYFLKEVSRDLNREGNRINKTFAGRFKVTHLGEEHYYVNTYKYVYQNPLRAGICKEAEKYKYSTLAGLLGNEPLIVPLADDFILFDGNPFQKLDWLNKLPADEDIKAIKKALTRGKFKLPRYRSNQRPHRLENELL